MPRHERTSFPFPMTVAYAGVLFIALTAVMRAVLSAFGVDPPARPEGPTLLNLYAFLVPAHMLLAGALALVARGLSGGFLARWLILGSFGWIAYSLNASLGMSAMATTGAVDPLALAVYLLALTAVPAFAAAAVAAGTFVPDAARKGFPRRVRAVWRTRSAASWAWRLPLVVVAFVAIAALVTFVLLPVVGAAPAERALSTRGILLVELLRGLLLSAVVLPVLAAWERSSRQLVATLVVALAAPAAAASFVLGYFLPVPERLVGVAEVFFTATILSGVGVVLLLGAHADEEIDVANRAELAQPA